MRLPWPQSQETETKSALDRVSEDQRMVPAMKALEIVSDVERKLGAKLTDTRAMIDESSVRSTMPATAASKQPDSVRAIRLQLVADSSAANIEQVVSNKFSLPALEQIQNY